MNECNQVRWAVITFFFVYRAPSRISPRCVKLPSWSCSGKASTATQITIASCMPHGWCVKISINLIPSAVTMVVTLAVTSRKNAANECSSATPYGVVASQFSHCRNYIMAQQCRNWGKDLFGAAWSNKLQSVQIGATASAFTPLWAFRSRTRHQHLTAPCQKYVICNKPFCFSLLPSCAEEVQVRFLVIGSHCSTHTVAFAYRCSALYIIIDFTTRL